MRPPNPTDHPCGLQRHHQSLSQQWFLYGRPGATGRPDTTPGLWAPCGQEKHRKQSFKSSLTSAANTEHAAEKEVKSKESREKEETHFLVRLVNYPFKDAKKILFPQFGMIAERPCCESSLTFSCKSHIANQKQQ